jgi:hypothetical protein
VNENASSELNTVTLNKFSTYDVYDYTPLFRIDQITDNAQDVQEKSGFKFDTEFSLNTYTITTPRINDILLFPYDANNKNLIYRVKSITTLINSLTENVKFYTLNLEYASIKNVDTLKLFNHYVYLITEGINVTKSFYVNFLSDLNRIKELLKEATFDNNLEIYSNLTKNENIILLSFLNRFDNYFHNIKKPFFYIGFDSKISVNSNKELIKLINKINVDIENAKL